MAAARSSKKIRLPRSSTAAASQCWRIVAVLCDTTIKVERPVVGDDARHFPIQSIDRHQLFELLLSVSGVGPKVALAMLSALSAEQVRTAIAGG